MSCGFIWDGNAELWPDDTCPVCNRNKRTSDVRDLGRVILGLKRSDLLHHGKLK